MICAQSVNGIDNRAGTMALARRADPDFYTLISALRRIQQSGSVGVRLERKEGQVQTILFFERDTDDQIRQDVETVRQLLALESAEHEFKLVYGRLPKSSGELAILSRSVMEILLEISTAVEAPLEDIQEGRAAPVLTDVTNAPPELAHIMRIHSGEGRPADAYVSVSYRDRWFWIDDRDFRSKGTLTFLMILFSLAETGGKTGGPVVTIPAG
jgi:hypothetical protein